MSTIDAFDINLTSTMIESLAGSFEAAQASLIADREAERSIFSKFCERIFTELAIRLNKEISADASSSQAKGLYIYMSLTLSHTPRTHTHSFISSYLLFSDPVTKKKTRASHLVTNRTGFIVDFRLSSSEVSLLCEILS